MGGAAKPATLHLRAIHTLVRAIQTRDGHAPGCRERVEACALELGRRLGMEERDLQALQAASILRDIGTLAVPRHILSKPGQLTPEEFEKMKIHPAVGAEIVERMEFPFPVAPIVRSHHERWDGGGYPDSLKAEAIPLGARILAVADCLAAQSAEEGLEALASGAGAAFDPEVVRVARDVPCAAHPQRPADLPAAIEVARHEEVDALTSLPNARALSLCLDAELARCRCHGGSLAVLICDVEGLRRHDWPGLRQVASGLRGICREEDCVARMGDAFVLVLGGFSPRDLAEKQRRIESRLEELGVAGSGEHRLAVKVGAAFYPADGADAGELLAAADARLRLARQGGADRFATELAELGGALEDPRVRGEQARRVPR